jgi:predicted  nucleic acid-binding Zn-ribbon protein
MRLLKQFAQILVKGLAALVSTPEVLRLRAELAYVNRRLDEFEVSVDRRFAELRAELHAEAKRLEMRMQEMERETKALRLRVEATERALRQLPGIQHQASSSGKKIGLA